MQHRRCDRFVPGTMVSVASIHLVDSPRPPSTRSTPWISPRMTPSFLSLTLCAASDRRVSISARLQATRRRDLGKEPCQRAF